MKSWQLRILQGMKEAQRNKDRELSYSKDLRKMDVIERSDKHIAKLQSYLDNCNSQEEVLIMMGCK